MQDRKHILFLPAWYPSKEDTMLGLFIQKHAELLTNDFDVSVLYFNSLCSKDDNRKIIISKEHNVNVLRVNYCGKNKYLKIIFFFITLHKAYKILKKRFGKPDFSHVHILTRMGVIALLLKILYKIPYVITEQWSRYLPENNSYNGFLRKFITKIVCKYASGISSISNYLAMHMKINNLAKNKNYFILRNTVNGNIFKLKYLNNNNVKKFIHVSCFENKSKNLILLLDALQLLKQLRTDFRCTLIGKGIDFDMITKYAIEICVDDVTEFKGVLPEKDVAEEMKKSNFYVQSSNYETFCAVIAEALCCGLPIVSTKVGAIPEIVNSDNGLLVEPNNPELLKDALNKMLDSYDMYNSAFISEKSINLFSNDTVLNQFKDFYNISFSNCK